MELDPLGTGFHLELDRTWSSFHLELGRLELIPLGTRALGSRALGSGALGSESQHPLWLIKLDPCEKDKWKYKDIRADKGVPRCIDADKSMFV